MKTSKADWTNAAGAVPWIDDSRWESRLAKNPESLYRIVADSYDVVLREREVAEGRQRSGRRPKPDLVPLADVFDAVFPERFSADPFRVALKALIGDEAQRLFAARVPCHQGTISKLLSGELLPDMAMLEGLAAAGGKDPWYFLEWRAGYVASLVQRALTTKPELSISVMRGLSRRA